MSDINEITGRPNPTPTRSEALEVFERKWRGETAEWRLILSKDRFIIERGGHMLVKPFNKVSYGISGVTLQFIDANGPTRVFPWSRVDDLRSN